MKRIERGHRASALPLLQTCFSLRGQMDGLCCSDSGHPGGHKFGHCHHLGWPCSPSAAELQKGHPPKSTSSTVPEPQRCPLLYHYHKVTGQTLSQKLAPVQTVTSQRGCAFLPCSHSAASSSNKSVPYVCTLGCGWYLCAPLHDSAQQCLNCAI